MVLFVAFLAAFSSTESFAAGQIFSVRNVAVDESAGDAQEARRVAIRVAQAEAWRRLVRRMVTSDPSLVSEPDTETLETFVQSLEFDEEKITTGRYRADITVRFRADAVLGWLELAGVPHTNAPSPVLLVLPVLTTPEAVLLWEEGNPWFAAWQRSRGLAQTVELVAPVGDLDDLLVITTEGATGGDWTAMQSILSRYQADGVLVAEIDGRGTTELSWYEGPEAQIVPSGSARTLPALEQEADPMADQVQDEVEIDTTVLDDVAEVVDDAGDLVEEAGDAVVKSVDLEVAGLVDYDAQVTQVRVAVDNFWTLATMAPEGPEAVMVAEITIRNLAEWVDIRDRLARSAALNETTPLVVSVDHVRILLRYVGTLSQLRASLRQAGLGLTAQGDNWIILPL